MYPGLFVCLLLLLLIFVDEADVHSRTDCSWFCGSNLRGQTACNSFMLGLGISGVQS